MAKRSKINWSVVGAVVLGLIMLGSTVGYIVGMVGYGDGTSVYLNGFNIKIRSDGLGYETTVKGKTVPFTYSPIALNSTIASQAAIDKLISSKYIIFTSNSTSLAAQDIALMQFELGRIFQDNFNIQTQIAFTTPVGAFPVIGCENSSVYVPVVEFRDTNDTAIYSEGNCVIVASQSSTSYIILRDRLVYGLFGILPGTR